MLFGMLPMRLSVTSNVFCWYDERMPVGEKLQRRVYKRKSFS